MRSRLLLGLALLVFSAVAQAANYTLSATKPAFCSGTWAASGSTYTCSGKVTLASGDVVSSSAAATIRAGEGYQIAGSTLGSNSVGVSIVATGSSAITVTATSRINGSVTSGSGVISLTGTTVTGAVTTSDGGKATFSGGSVAGAVTVPGGVTASNGVTFGSSITTSAGGDVTLAGGSVTGAVSAGGVLTATGGVTFSSSVSGGAVNLTGGSVAGTLTSTYGALTTNNTNVSGNVTAGSGIISITGGTLNGNISGNCCKVGLSGATLTGNVSTNSGDIDIATSTVNGNLTTNQKITLTNTTVYGGAQAASWSTISGDSASKVYGNCAPTATSPSNLCNSTAITSCYVDNFDRSTLGDDWAVTSRNGSFGTPRIVAANNASRLRLTDNGGNVSTAATLNRLFPAKGNFVQLQFKYYGYGGNGADGVAVVLSDGSVTPQPGAFGGPLGYGLRGNQYFAGGWLGIGIDEYGNFSNEGGVGSVGFRPDSVAIRGAAGPNNNSFRWLAGTSANLDPGVDVSGSTPGPGHTYRITVDSMTSGKTLVSVDRDTGSGFKPLISSFDAQSAQGQTAVPANFYLSFTGSTGGSNNYHELDDMQICATQISSSSTPIDHFDFSYTSPGLTCTAQEMTVRACANASCSSLYTGETSVVLSGTGPAANYWSATAPARMNGTTLTFSGGSAVVQLRHTVAEDVTLGYGASTPAAKPLSTPTCSTAGCKLTFAESGFLIDIPNMTANKPVTGSIRAVRASDKAGICAPGFADVTRTINFSATYSDPTGPSSSGAIRPISINSVDLIPAASGATPAAKGISLAFDRNGSAPLTVRYTDAGQMKVSATYSGGNNNDAYLSMKSGTGDALFVSKPYGLCVTAPSSVPVAKPEAQSCRDGSVGNCAVFPGGIRAGDAFPLTIQAVGWEADGEALTAGALCDNIVTPNFVLPAFELKSTLVAPANGVPGVLTPATYDHAAGAQNVVSSKQSEVGVFTITAAPTAGYFGQTVSGGTSGYVGRFIPAMLRVEDNSPKLAPSCMVNSATGFGFSYQGQDIGWAASQSPAITVTGVNRDGFVTRNYDRGAFWRLSSQWSRSYGFGTDDKGVHENARLSGGASPNNEPSFVESGASDGDGARQYAFAKDKIRYAQRNYSPVGTDAPFEPYVTMSIDPAATKDSDGACYTGGNNDVGAACASYRVANISFTGSGNAKSVVRLGRVRIDNASGSELSPLALPLHLETYTGNGWALSSDDSCSVIGAVSLDTYTDRLSAGKTTATVAAPSNGAGRVTLSAPGSGNYGTVRVVPSVPEFLKFDWLGAGQGFQAPSATAFFGIYKGSEPLIFRREVYR